MLQNAGREVGPWPGKASGSRGTTPGVIGLLCLVLLAPPAPAQDRDQEIWIEQRFSYSLSQKTFLRFRLFQGANDNISHLFETFVQMDFGLHVRPWLTLMPGFLHDRQDPFGRNSRFENRPQLTIFLHTRRGRWRPNLRLTVEGRFLQQGPGFVRFLSQPSVEYVLSTYKARPLLLFLANEFAVDSRTSRFSRNRFQIGLSLPATEHFSIIPYYMSESNRLPELWDHDNIWGLILGWHF